MSFPAGSVLPSKRRLADKRRRSVMQAAFASWDYRRFRPAVAALLADGRMANADVNGAYNILRKSKQNFDFEGLCKGLLDSPLRIRIS